MACCTTDSRTIGSSPPPEGLAVPVGGWRPRPDRPSASRMRPCSPPGVTGAFTRAALLSVSGASDDIVANRLHDLEVEVVAFARWSTGPEENRLGTFDEDDIRPAWRSGEIVCGLRSHRPKGCGRRVTDRQVTYRPAAAGMASSLTVLIME